MRVHYLHIPLLDSTNTWAKNHLAECDVNGLTVISTDYQTKGRGSYDRTWQSVAGQNILATCVFFMKEEVDIAYYVQKMAYAAQALLLECGVQSEIKWPNDLLVEGKKIAGILCETAPFGQTTAFITGIGLNVHLDQQEAASISQPATSLWLQTKKRYCLQKLLSRLCSLFLQELKIRIH